ncbi:MAG: hypothetical protein KFH87_01010 [Bacteroidetes bacterium]|nr:hypothetical protein [Bacteroidota bacterium]
MARRRVDIFFILYLTAIVAFVVVSRERDQLDEEMQQTHEHIVRTFLPTIPLRFERDTLRFFVDADISGVILGAPPFFRSKIFVEDITYDDHISMTVHSVFYNDTLTSSSIVKMGTRTGIGSMADRTVYFPLAVQFPRTGTYRINLEAAARRVHEVEEGVFSYHGFRFDTTLVSPDLIDAVERARASLTVVVEDTSVAVSKNMRDLHLEAARSAINSSVGFEARNTITVNLASNLPRVSIVRGGGSLHELDRGDGNVVYQWSGIVSSVPDTVEIEARVFRDAGGKDIARTRFAVHGVQPFLHSTPPTVLYSGESIDFDLQVDGLDEQSQYLWRLFERPPNGELLMKTEGRGSRVSYRIPNSYAEKWLVINATYSDRSFRVLSPRSYALSDSRFSFPVKQPPTRIDLQFPADPGVSSVFRFKASRYHDPRFRGEQPIARLAEVDVRVFDESDNLLPTEVWMVRRGEFEFELARRAALSKTRLRIRIEISAAGSTVHRHIQLN